MLRHFLQEYLGLRRRMSWDRTRIEAFQGHLLRVRVRHAYEHIPYYKSLFDRAGIVPTEIRSVGDLVRVPVTRKIDLRRHTVEELVARGTALSRCGMVKTSGSTGVPQAFYLSPAEIGRRKAVWARFFKEAGANLLARRFGLDHGLVQRRSPWYHRLGIKWQRSFVAKPGFEGAVSEARRFRPRYISGMPSLLHLFALAVRGGAVHDIRPKFVHSGGETLLPDTRRLLETTFQAPVHDTYTATEFGLMATPCPEGKGYHVATDTLVVECLRDGRPVGPVEPGELVVTDLMCRVMPLIRYAMGDIARLGQGSCLCGSPRPRIEGIQGRQDDLVILPGGEMVSSLLATKPLFSIEEILQYRVTQESVRRFRIELVLQKSLADDRLREIREYYVNDLGAEEVQFEVVPCIPADPSGKLRRVISRVPQTRGT